MLIDQEAGASSNSFMRQPGGRAAAMPPLEASQVPWTCLHCDLPCHQHAGPHSQDGTPAPAEGGMGGLGYGQPASRPGREGRPVSPALRLPGLRQERSLPPALHRALIRPTAPLPSTPASGFSSPGNTGTSMEMREAVAPDENKWNAECEQEGWFRPPPFHAVRQEGYLLQPATLEPRPTTHPLHQQLPRCTSSARRTASTRRATPTRKRRWARPPLPATPPHVRAAAGEVGMTCCWVANCGVVAFDGFSRCAAQRSCPLAAPGSCGLPSHCTTHQAGLPFPHDR